MWNSVLSGLRRNLNGHEAFNLTMRRGATTSAEAVPLLFTVRAGAARLTPCGIGDSC
jgi:hypothetical protein